MKEQSSWLIVLASIAMLALLETIGLLAPVRQFGERVINPVLTQSVKVVQAVKSPFQAVFQNVYRYQQLQDLELRYSEALAQLAAHDALKKENEELRKVLEAKQSTSNQLENSQSSIAPIISYGQPSLGRGQTDGVGEGNPVFVARTLVGRIGKVSSNQAEVVLLSSVLSLPVLAKSESGVTGIVVGNGRQVLMKEVPIEVEVRVGERVDSVGQPGLLPGVLIGRIQAINREEGLSTQTLVIDQIVSFFESNTVEVQK